MKILFVRTYCPNRILYGSEMRADLFVDHFHKQGDVDLLTLTAPNEHTDTAYIQAKFNQHHYFDQAACHRRLGKLEKLLTLAPWQITGHYAKDLQNKLNALLEAGQYDLIFVFKLEPVLYFLNLPSRWRERVVIDFDDILSDLYLNHYPGFFTARKNSGSLKLYEHRALRQFRRVFVCSREAASRIEPRLRHKVGIMPNVLAADPGRFLARPGPANRLLFVGSLDYFPNLEGLKWFCRQIWPEFLKAFPAAELSIVGKTPKDARDVEAFLGHPPRAQVTVNVPGVAPYYENCLATLVPLLNGSGTRVKILESASYGRPVITTAIGLEGLDFKPERDIFIFKDAASFIDAYLVLLEQKKYTQVARDALGVLREKYSPEVFSSSLNENWPMMVEGKGH